MATAFRRWAFWRRVQYGTAFAIPWIILGVWLYVSYGIVPPNCADGVQNGDERGVDCGGSCVRLCAFEITPPAVEWAESFEIAPGQYNAVAYVRNENVAAGTPRLPYTLTLADSSGIITEVTGETVLPPDSVYPIFAGRIDTGNRVPTNTTLTLGEPDAWLPASAGRGQFTLVNRQFFDTNTGRPRLEATIRNEAFTEANEVEFVATIFNIDGVPLTASRTFVDNFAAESQERIVFTWPNPIATTLRSCEIPTDVVLAIDLSGSMNNDQADPPEPITSVLEAASAFATRLEENDQIGVVTFATDAATALPLTDNTASAQSLLQTLSIAPEEETGFTNTSAALSRASDELRSDRANQNARKVLVLLTDGLATAPQPEPEEAARVAAQTTKEHDIEIYSIGLGESVNMDFVRAIATRGTQAYQALDRADVDAIYETITSSICESGPAQMDIIPKTGASFTPLP